jgi:hypothetical protein
MKDNIIRAAVTVFVAIAVVTAFWIGLGVGSRPVEVAAPEPAERRMNEQMSKVRKTACE